MGDCLKISKDKRHRSSSSLTGVVVEGTRSERKLDIRASIPEVEDQFALAEARCDDLQEKIDLVKVLRRKRKLKKRSMTRVAEQVALPENIPFISVRTQPKKKVSQQAARLHRLEVPPNPTRGYLDPATVEQHRMLGIMRGQAYRQPQHEQRAKSPLRDSKSLRARRARADGDSMCCQGAAASDTPIEVACGEDDIVNDYSDNDVFDLRPEDFAPIYRKKPAEPVRQQSKIPVNRRRYTPRDVPQKDAGKRKETSVEVREACSGATSTGARRRLPLQKHEMSKPSAAGIASQLEERPVVELFNKNRANPQEVRRAPAPHTQPLPDKRNKKVRETQNYEEQDTGMLDDVTSTREATKKWTAQESRHPRRVKYRSRRYELPTVASQMKQAGMRYYYGNANHTNIPFVVSKSTAPSHNIGVNIQQVLNGLKVQQPLSGIPSTIAHHMGLSHIESNGARSSTLQPLSLDNREINAIKLGERLLRLPSYKYISYNRLLSLYRKSDGMVSRFLRAISRPHYFYTSMYNLPTNREDFDAATSKGRGASHEAKQSLAEYASLYREYENIDKCIREGNYEPELERRRDELSRELAAREEHIRKVVQEYKTSGDVEQSTLRASASTAEDGYRHSTFKLNLGDQQQ